MVQDLQAGIRAKITAGVLPCRFTRTPLRKPPRAWHRTA